MRKLEPYPRGAPCGAVRRSWADGRFNPRASERAGSAQAASRPASPTSTREKDCGSSIEPVPAPEGGADTAIVFIYSRADGNFSDAGERAGGFGAGGVAGGVADFISRTGERRRQTLPRERAGRRSTSTRGRVDGHRDAERYVRACVRACELGLRVGTG